MKTKTLDLPVMLALIRFHEDDPTRLDLTPWVQAVPDELRQPIESMLQCRDAELRELFLHKAATEETRHQIVGAIHAWVWTDLAEGVWAL